jgi:hypothetical protein
MRERSNMRKTLQLSLVVAALALGAAPATASAEEIVIGERVSGPGDACHGGNNASNSHVTVCFQPYGEWLYVKDGDDDHRSAFGEIENRDRVCRNKNGQGTWVRCNYSFGEGDIVVFRGWTRDAPGDPWAGLTLNRTGWTADLA